MKHDPNKTGLRLALPFFVTLAVLTVVSFIIPLRPSQSQMEKRNLAEFPEFSRESLLSGDYFEDISTWFSDTFPGRESWIALSANISSLHGHSEFAIAGDLPVVEEMADTSPICSIMAAMAMGAMTRMAEMSNLAITNCCRPTIWASFTAVKST